MQSCSWFGQRKRQISGRDAGPQPTSKKYWQEGHSGVSLPLPYRLPGKTQLVVVISQGDGS